MVRRIVDNFMEMNLGCDGYFVEGEAWHEAERRFGEVLAECGGKRTVLLELGAGFHTPVFRFLSTRNKLRKNTVKQQILDISHDKTREYEERRCA